MNRRRFLLQSPVALAALQSAMRAQPGSGRVVLTVHTGDVIGTVAEDFMGLSYESTQLGQPEFFAPENTRLIQLFRTLSSSGVLRLGGNTSEFTWFQATPSSAAPTYSPLPTQPAQLTPITPKALENLRGFLDATGWRCIYGLNLGTGTPERAVQEATAASRALGARLKYFQIGNEPNNYIRYKLRPATWTAAAYLEQWLPFGKAVAGQVPGARIGGPDMGAEHAWMQLFAERVPAELGSSLAEMTDHFYAEGPPTSPSATIESLFSLKKIGSEIAVMQEAGKISGRPYRMTEVNSCYLGGKPGVSDTLAAAVWAGDLTLQLAASGFSGINFHGGSSRQIKASLGGTLPGDSVSKAAAAADSYYTPIAGDQSSGFTARPIFYGMMLAARFAGLRLVRVSGVSEGVRAYAALDKANDRLLMALLHPADHVLSLNLRPGAPFRKASLQHLEAPAFDASRGITFAGSGIEATGEFRPSEHAWAEVSFSLGLDITLAPYSAALVTFQRT